MQENQVEKRKFLLVLVATSLSVCYDNAYKPLEPINPPNTTGKTSNVMSSRLCNALTGSCLWWFFLQMIWKMLIYDFFFSRWPIWTDHHCHSWYLTIRWAHACTQSLWIYVLVYSSIDSYIDLMQLTSMYVNVKQTVDGNQILCHHFEWQGG